MKKQVTTAKFTKNFIKIFKVATPIIDIFLNIYRERRKEFREQQFQQIYFYGNVVGQLGVLRYQFLTIISGIAIAILGIITSRLSIREINICLLFALLLTFFVFISSSIIYLAHSRKEMKYFQAVQKEIPKLRLGRGLKTPDPELFNHWPEILLFIQIIAIILVVISFIIKN